MTDSRLDDRKILLVTGGSRGIGAATVRLACQSGWSVCINYHRSGEKAQALVDALRAQGATAIAIQADVSVEAEVLAMFKQIDGQLGPLTALVNCAGIIATQSKFVDIDIERLKSLFSINVFGSFLCAREAVKRMSKASGGSGGAIANISSSAARIGSPNEFIDYAATKGAIDTMTLGMAKELGGQGIRVNAIRPGLVDSDMQLDTEIENRLEKLAATIPMKRAGTVEEIAQSIVWVISSDASYVNGALIDVAGGR